MVHPATLEQVSHFHRLGLRERTLGLVVMMAFRPGNDLAADQRRERDGPADSDGSDAVGFAAQK